MLIQTRASYLADECIAHALGVKAEDFEAAIRDARRERNGSRMDALLATAERQRAEFRRAKWLADRAFVADCQREAALNAQANLEARNAAGFAALDSEQEQAEAERQEREEFLLECRKVARQTLVYGVPYLLALGGFFAAMRIAGLI